MAQKKKTYSFVLVISLLALFLPMIVTYLKYSKRDGVDDTTYNKPDLTGLVINDNKPVFSWSAWFDGSFQAESEDYNNDHWAFKEKMVRVNNQFYYKAFNQIRVNNFVSGKDHYVFSEAYIYSAFGDDLLDENKVSDLMRKARVVQDTLKQKGIDLVLALAPGKGMMCKEFVEDKYVHDIKNTNYSMYVRSAKKLGNNLLDLCAYFEKLKPSSPYPLFTRFGHHWSYYAECLAVDTIISYIEHLHGTDLPDIHWDNIEVSDTARSRDADVLGSMNLSKDPDMNMKLAYPEVQFEIDSLKNRTRVLTIADSYWYGPVYMGVDQSCFAGGQFWYYCNKVIPSPREGEKVEAWELDLKTEIESNQVIMLLYSDGNLRNFGNNFIEDAYELYTSPKTYYARSERNKQVQTFAKQIRESPLLLKKATQKSRDESIQLDSAIKSSAMKMAGLDQ